MKYRVEQLAVTDLTREALAERLAKWAQAERYETTVQEEGRWEFQRGSDLLGAINPLTLGDIKATRITAVVEIRGEDPLRIACSMSGGAPMRLTLGARRGLEKELAGLLEACEAKRVEAEAPEAAAGEAEAGDAQQSPPAGGEGTQASAQADAGADTRPGVCGCGSPLEPGARFCSECGRPVTKEDGA